MDLIERLLYRWKGIFVIFKSEGALLQNGGGNPG
jgi:hypothetical protein